MNTIIKSQDGFVWMDVTDKAHAIFESKLFELQELWFREEENRVYRIPIESEEDLKRAIESDRKVCIYVGQIDKSISMGIATQDSWSAADKIAHNGYIYVRLNDLVFEQHGEAKKED